MFGCHAVYVKEKIVLILRRREQLPEMIMEFGLQQAASITIVLEKDFPGMRTIALFGGAESGWQNLPADSEHFEEEVMKACNLILKRRSTDWKNTKAAFKKTIN